MTAVDELATAEIEGREMVVEDAARGEGALLAEETIRERIMLEYSHDSCKYGVSQIPCIASGMIIPEHGP